jgi:hypothetical protein
MMEKQILVVESGKRKKSFSYRGLMTQGCRKVSTEGADPFFFFFVNYSDFSEKMDLELGLYSLGVPTDIFLTLLGNRLFRRVI